MDSLFDERSGQVAPADVAPGEKIAASAGHVEAPGGAEIIDFVVRREARLRISTWASHRDIETSLTTIETKLLQLADAVELARYEAAVSPLLLEGILRAVTTRQDSMLAYAQGSFPPLDPAS